MELAVAPLEEVQIVDAGDVAVTPYDISEACTQIQDRILEVAGDRQRRVVAIGGDHTIALPSLRALHSLHGP
ncbi:MAG: agmatinase, partial [Mycobacterium sp.]|nr:agmatinase [Mycobacterium sp.]